MLTCQQSAFSLNPDHHFLNCATFSPTSKAVEAAGVAAIKQMADPYWLAADHFFDGSVSLRNSLAKLIEASDPNQIALVPSVSYGMATVAQGLKTWPNALPGHQILSIETEFPDHVYAFERVAAEKGLTVASVAKTENWSEAVVSAINAQTAAVIVPHVHWTFGTVFDLKAISLACQKHGAMLVIDGTQSVGAMPLSVADIQPDALIVAAYKWMMGPYSTGFGYFSSFFDSVTPIEESWMNRANARDFKNLNQLNASYMPQAQRHNMGESANFIGNAMFQTAVDELLNWNVAEIQAYCKNLVAGFVGQMQDFGCRIHPQTSAHLLGIEMPSGINADLLSEKLKENHIFVAVRGHTLRVSPHIYNTEENLDALVGVFKNALK